MWASWPLLCLRCKMPQLVADSVVPCYYLANQGGLLTGLTLATCQPQLNLLCTAILQGRLEVRGAAMTKKGKYSVQMARFL